MSYFTLFRKRNKCVIFMFVFVLFASTLFQTGAFASELQKTIEMDEDVVHALDWLLSQQKETGEWDTEPTIRNTSEILQLMSDTGVSKERYKLGVHFLEKQKASNFDQMSRILPFLTDTQQRTESISAITQGQNDDGGWGLAHSYASDVLDTTIVLQGLLNLKNDKLDNDSVINGANYLLKQQREDGSWAYQEKGASSPSLTAQIILTLDQLVRNWDEMDVTTPTKQIKKELQTSILQGAQYLSSSDLLLSLETFDQPQETLHVLSALIRTLGIPNLDQMIQRVKELQHPNGSWIEDPYTTKLVIDFLLDSQLQSVSIEDIELFKMDGEERKESLHFNAYDVLLAQPVFTSSTEVNVQVVVQSPKQEMFVLEQEGELYHWPVHSAEPGEYVLTAHIKDSQTGVLLMTASKGFSVTPSFNWQSTTVAKPGQAVVNEEVEVPLTVHLYPFVNIVDNLTVTTRVVDASGETVAEASKEHTNDLSGDVVILPMLTFSPEVSVESSYTIETNLSHHEKVIFEESTIFEVLPEPIPPKVEARQKIEDKALHPEADEVNVSFELEGIGKALEETREPIDFVLTIDNSGSMEWGNRDYVYENPNRLDFAIEASKHVVDLIDGEDRGAVVQFAGTVWIQQEFTSDKDLLKQRLDDTPQSPWNGTAIGIALRDSINLINNTGIPKHKKVILLMSDGDDNRWSDYSILQEARRAANQGIVVHTVGLGSGADQSILQQIAQLTGGIYRFSPTMEELDAMMSEVGNQIFNISGRDVSLTTTLPSYVTIDEDQTSPKPKSVTTNDNGETVVSWDYDLIIFEQVEAIQLRLNTSVVEPNKEIVITRNTQLEYKDVEGINHTQSLPDLQIHSSGTLKVDVRVNQEEFYPNDVMTVNLKVENLSKEEKELQVDVQIVDENHELVEVISEFPVKGLQSDSPFEKDVEWVVSGTYEGNYTIVVKVKESDGTIITREIPISILADGTIKLQLHTDKETYQPGESIQITNKLENTSQNKAFERTEIVTKWLKDDGSILNEKREEVTLPAKSLQDISFTFEQGNIEPGVYTLQTEVISNGEVVVSDEILFTVAKNEDSYIGLTGNIVLSNKTFYLGQEVPVTYSITNHGNMDLKGINAELVLLDPEREEIVHQVPTTLDLSVGESKSISNMIPTVDFSIGDYLVTLQVQKPNGEWVNLDSTGFVLEVGLEADFRLDDTIPRVLLWTEKNQQEIASLLEELGAMVTVVNKEATFIEELRSGLYNLYFLHDSNRPLTAHYDQELLSKLHSGQGLLVTERFNLADFWTYDVFDRKRGKSGEAWSSHPYGNGMAAYLTDRFLQGYDENLSEFKTDVEQIIEQAIPNEEENHAGESIQYVMALTAKGASLDAKVRVPLPEGFQVLDSGDFVLNDNILSWDGKVAGDAPLELTFVTATPAEKGSYEVTAHTEFLVKEEWVSIEPTTISYEVLQGRDELFAEAIDALKQGKGKQGKGQINNTLQLLVERHQEPAETSEEREQLIDSLVKSLELLTKQKEELIRLKLERVLGYIEQKWFLEDRK
ncbi:VWA domain-containing protein [Bacillus sp. JJ1533]|uniref:VWA domain-containing protein n=1 Tax=Bacillus sp. JJ1533 TaxID=3122959 RepID=UPI002FFE2028